MALPPMKTGAVMRLEQMTLHWAPIGYNPAETVEEPGTFARRGGIVDIWPPNLSHPLRIDLFGDEIESLRWFDPATQRSAQRIDSVEIGPGSEALTKYGPAVLARLGIQGENLDWPVNENSPLRDTNLLLAYREEVRLEEDHIRQDQSYHGLRCNVPDYYEHPALLLYYISTARPAEKETLLAA